MQRALALALLAAPLVIGCSRGSESTWALNSGVSTQAQPGPEAPKPVEAYRADDVAAGFVGDVHPSLERQSPLTVSAAWSPIRPGRALGFGFFPEEFYAPFRGLQAAQPQREYDGRLLSGLLPASIESVGQVWTLDSSRVQEVLQQFHATASTHLEAPGRRAGPNGAFGMVRAISPDYAELAFRIHAEFHPEAGVWVTPSCFLGRLILNRQAGSVEYFHLSIPHDKALNATLTVRLETEALIDIVNVETMELAGGDPRAAEGVTWSEALDPAQVDQRLKEQFYQFTDIAWVPPEQAVAKAQELSKPIMALVLWGCLDEQNC